MSEPLTTPGGTRYHVLHPKYKYMVASTARFPVPPSIALELSGVDAVVMRARVGAVDIARITSTDVWVYPRYCFDGPTGGLDTKNFLDGSLVHDVLCQAIDEGRLSPSNQIKADALMRSVNLSHGMSRARAWWTWYAVRRYRSNKVASYEWPRI